MRPRLLAFAVVLALLVAGCGSDGGGATDAPKGANGGGSNGNAKPSGSDIVATCAQRTGQDIGAKPPAEPGFVDCLRELEAPPDVIAAWER